MAAERIGMRNIREILRLKLQMGLSDAQIAQSVNCSRSTVADYLRRARVAGIENWQQMEALNDSDTESLLFTTSKGRPPKNSPQRPLPNWIDIHAELKKHKAVNLTLALLWEEYKREHLDGYQLSQFNEYYRRWRNTLAISMRQEHRAGEKAFVDYCDGLPLTDRRTGELIPTELFIGVLGASSYTYAEASLSQDTSSWLLSHVHMYEYFGGVTEITVPDNLKSGIKKPCRYEPEINASYHDLAQHYGTAVIPARVKKPKDKAKAEAAVLVAQRWILASLRNNTFYNLQELNQAIRELLERLNEKVTRHLKKSRRELWETIDRPALMGLPAKPYEFSEWKQCRLHINYHIEFDNHHYSAPYTLIGQQLWCRATAQTIEILHKGVRVASHVRSFLKGKYTTIKEHMPPSHQAVAEWTPERISRWAAKIGPKTKETVEEIMTSKEHPQQGFNAALGVIRMAKEHGEVRLELACAKALTLSSPSYKTIKNMLKNRMESVELTHCLPGSVQAAPTVESQLPLGLQQNVRGKGYYH